MFEIDGTDIFSISEIKTPSQIMYIKSRLGSVENISLSVDKNTIVANGTDIATVTVNWVKFDTTQGIYVTDINNMNTINLDVSGTSSTVKPGGNITFSSAKAGSYAISTTNGGIDGQGVIINAQ